VSAVRRETQTGERAVAHGDGSALAAGADVRLERFVVARGSPVAGASIASTKLRSEMGAVVVAVLRDHRLELEIDPSRPVAAGALGMKKPPNAATPEASPSAAAPSSAPRPACSESQSP
jgi:ferric-dicitrate binding protein FerR (iron transport regulator)